MQHRGKLRPVLFIYSARLIGYYYELVTDVTSGNIVITKVIKAEKLANIDNICV